MNGNTWGQSWGACWGDTWGAETVAPPVGGGGIRYRPSETRRPIDDDELILIMFAQAVASGVIH